MSRVLSYIASVAAAAFLLAALAGPLPAASPRTLTVWAMGEEGIRISVMARKFEAENPGVRVRTQAIPWDAAHEKLLTAVVGDLPPDVGQLGTTWMAEFATLRGILPLEEFIEGSSEVKKENFFEGSWNTGLVDGKVYGIPWYVDTRVLFYRKDLLREAGFPEPPRTWEELREVCRRLTRDTDRDGRTDRYGIALPIRGWMVFVPFVWQNNGDVFHSTEPEFREALDYYLSFFREGTTPSGRGMDMDIFQAFKTGFYSMFVSGPWMVELLDRELPELAGKWGVAVMPGKAKRTSFVGGSNLVVFKGAREKDLAWKFIEFLSRPENQIEWYNLLHSLPASREAWRTPHFREHSMLRVFGEQMEDTQSPPNIPEWEQISNFIDTRMEAIILGEKILDGNTVETLAALEGDIAEILYRNKRRGGWTREFALSVGGLILAAAGAAWLVLIRRGRDRTAPGTAVPAGTKRTGKLSTGAVGYLFVLPAIVILTLFLFIPVLASFLISLTDWNIYGLADRHNLHFVGFRNYLAVFKDSIFWKSLWNTLFFTGVGVPFTVMISLLTATVLNEKVVRFKTFFRTSYFLPVVSTIVAVAVMWRWLYNPEFGVFNWILRSLSFPEFNWLADPRTSLASIILMAAWKNFGYNMVIFLAGLQGIPEALYESARIDGANVWQLFLHVTLPGLRTTMLFVVIMSTIGYLQCFAEPYIMTKGGPLNSTMTIVLYMYNQGFKFFELGYASALAYILFGIIFLFTFIQIRLKKSGFAGS